MKVAGIIGGLSPESTRHYYQWLCDGVREVQGDLNYPEILMATINQQFIYENKKAGNWPAIVDKVVAKARILEQAGADFLLIASNTMHNVADDVEKAVSLPLLHLADATAMRVSQAGLNTVGMLSTIESAELDFYKERFSRNNIDVLVPEHRQDRMEVDRIINEELCKGVVRPESKEFLMQQVQIMQDRSAQGLILGCTEIDMLVGPDDFSCPVFDTTRIHVDEVLRLILDQGPVPKVLPSFRSSL